MTDNQEGYNSITCIIGILPSAMFDTWCRLAVFPHRVAYHSVIASPPL